MRNMVISSSELEEYFNDMLDHAKKKEKETESNNYVAKAFWTARIKTFNEIREYLYYFGQFKDM